MTLFQLLENEAATRGLGFLIIGAHAINQYGFSRDSKIPKLQHVIALKVHAMKFGHARRFLKDFLDVVGLVKANRWDVASNEIRGIFERYGTSDLYEKVVRDCVKD